MTTETALEHSLMSGPRGRRVLLEFALASEFRFSGGTAGPVRESVERAALHLDRSRPAPKNVFGHIGTAPRPVTQPVPVEEVAQQLAHVRLAAVTPPLLRDCLFRAVDLARYWQEPDEFDLLAADPEMRVPLNRIAAHLATAPETATWAAALAECAQWTVTWEGSAPSEAALSPRELLRDDGAQVREAEVQARRDFPRDPTASISGRWWSRPPFQLFSSAGELVDGSPTKLWFVEDSLGWETALAQRLHIPPGLRVYEIDSSNAWIELCRRFPLDASAHKRYDWYRTTARVGAWVIPDWERVAEHYDAVHLPVLSYLANAGRALVVDDDRASVIAGWDPDQTFWFTPDVRPVGDRVAWRFTFEDQRAGWAPMNPHH